MSTHPKSSMATELRNLLAGVTAGWATVGAMLWWDVLGLGGLIAAAEHWQIPALMLFWAFGSTFGIAAMATGLTIGTAAPEHGLRVLDRPLRRRADQPMVASTSRVTR